MESSLYTSLTFVVRALIGMKWYLKAVLNHIYLMTRDIEHFKKLLLAIMAFVLFYFLKTVYLVHLSIC